MQFSEHSYGFRPKRGAHDALKTCLKLVNEGYVYVVSMDLASYFDTVNHSKLIEVLSRTIRALHLEEWKVHMLANSRKGTWRASRMLSVALTKEILDIISEVSLICLQRRVSLNKSANGDWWIS